LKKALDKGLIHPATESLVVAITLVESWNLGDGDDCDDYIENDGAVVEDYDCVVDSAFDDPTLGDFISDIIFEGGVDCYMEFDGDKYHKSNLVNNMLNSSTKLLSSDRNVRSMTKQSISTKNNDEADDSEQVVISDTIATIAKVKRLRNLLLCLWLLTKYIKELSLYRMFCLKSFKSVSSMEKCCCSRSYWMVT